jgi:hypothetical protein
MRAIRVAAFVAAVWLCAAPASASNMAFALRLQVGGGGQELRFVALPYEYAPSTAEELCADLGESAVAEVFRWDEAASVFVVHPCGTGAEDFTLAEGVAYGVRTVAGQAINALLVGAHDAAFTLTLAPGVGSNLSWVSPPYHAAIPDRAGILGVADAEDLCLAIGEETVFAIVRWDETQSAYTAHVCGSVFDEGFELTVGEGYGLVNAEGQDISWQPEHY